MWTDNETDIDLLGYTVHKDLIKSVVLDDSILPVSIGVFGDWGSGKSSIMKMLQKDFDEDDDVACVYFEGILESLKDNKTVGSSIVDEVRQFKYTFASSSVFGFRYTE